MNRIGALVYQVGIANVFEIENASPTRGNRGNEKQMRQGDFRSCESFAQGLKEAGWDVYSYCANVAGDVTLADWHEDLDDQDHAPFAEEFRPVGNYYRSIIRCPECNRKEYMCECGFMQYLEMHDEMYVY